jgi:hypothetical protein
MKCLPLVLAIFAALAGVIAARKWYVASRVDVVPFDMVNGHLVELPTSDVQTWINSLRRTLKKSGHLNKSAALWTAASVALFGLSALASVWVSSN